MQHYIISTVTGPKSFLKVELNALFDKQAQWVTWLRKSDNLMSCLHLKQKSHSILRYVTPCLNGSIPCFFKIKPITSIPSLSIWKQCPRCMHHLVETYKPQILWSDGHWMVNHEYWKSKEFLVWLATNLIVKDTVIWNDWRGLDISCKQGSFFTCHDKFLPPTPPLNTNLIMSFALD
jgi:hypothetical protein